MEDKDNSREFAMYRAFRNHHALFDVGGRLIEIASFRAKYDLPDSGSPCLVIEARRKELERFYNQ